MGTEISLDDLRRRLDDPIADKARVRFCSEVSVALEECGRSLWAFGSASDQAAREAVALVAQTAGALARGAVSLFQEQQWYAGAALVRQLIEAEYLLSTSPANQAIV